MEEYRRWEDNIKLDLKEIGVDVMRHMSYLWSELRQVYGDPEVYGHYRVRVRNGDEAIPVAIPVLLVCEVLCARRLGG